jgi:hypothetical protein
VQAWDGSAWQTVASESSNSNSEVNETFSPVLTSKLRLFTDVELQVAVNEFEIYTGGF